MYSLKANVLEGCPYSENLIILLNKNNIPIEYKRIKNADKEKYKTSEIHTFPQIYLNGNNMSYLIGGFDDVNEIFNILKLNKLNIIKKKISNKFPSWDYKIILRLIQVLTLKTTLPS
jgi:glutaredoxin